MPNTARPKNTELVFKKEDQIISIKLIELIRHPSVIKVINELTPRHEVRFHDDSSMYELFWELRDQARNTKFINCTHEVDING